MKIKINLAVIQWCIDKGIKHFYTVDGKEIFSTLREVPKINTLTGTVWFFFFNKELELYGFTL